MSRLFFLVKLENFRLKIVRLRQQHKQELQTVINEMSTNTTETRLSDLMKKIQIQESTILQLKVENEVQGNSQWNLFFCRNQLNVLMKTREN